MSNKEWSKKRLWLGVILVLILAIACYCGVPQNLTFAQVKANSLRLHTYVQQQYAWSVFLYICTYISVVLCCLPGIALLNVIGGFVFGVAPTLVFAIFAATTGAIAIFFMMRYMIGAYVQMRFARRLEGFNSMVEKRGWLFLLMLRLFPMLPFFTINLLASMTKIKVSIFIWTTAVGIIPSTLVFAFAGKQLGSLLEFRQLFSLPILAALFALVVMVSVSYLLNRRYKFF